MYNAPRAASIVAKTAVRVWALDRTTFQHMLMSTTSAKRQKYEQFLAKVPLLGALTAATPSRLSAAPCCLAVSLDKYERAKIADALQEEHFGDDDCVIAEGDRGQTMYFVKEGGAKAMKALGEDAEPQVVMEYKDGDYFGELALLNDNPRAASVYAVLRL